MPDPKKGYRVEHTMTKKNPFTRTDDPEYDVLMAEKYYVLSNLHRKWKAKHQHQFDTIIRKVIFAAGKSWDRMDIVFTQSNTEVQTIIGEFLEHYHPEGVPLFDADRLFKKVKGQHRSEYVQLVEPPQSQ